MISMYGISESEVANALLLYNAGLSAGGVSIGADGVASGSDVVVVDLLASSSFEFEGISRFVVLKLVELRRDCIWESLKKFATA